ncbi:MAG: LTA synthase family protein [Deltaproteobacteria bacterium]|nr:LTA synthase family protein [Deltaproteobacteria bacterium]
MPTKLTKTELRLLDFRALVQTFPLGLLIVVESVVFKAGEAAAATGSGSALVALTNSAPDAAFAVALAAVFAVLLSVTRGAWRAGVSVLFHLVALVFLLLNAASHGYFAATGSPLSASTVVYTLENMGIVSDIAARETTSSRLGLLIVQILAVAVSAVAAEIGPVRRRLERVPFPRTRWTRLLLVGTAAASAGLLLVPAGTGAAAMNSRSIPVAIVVDAVKETFGRNDAVTIRDGERQGGDLAFARNPDRPRPNIVFIIFESLSWKQSDIYSPGRGVTPFLAELARKSLVVDRMYTIVPHTTKAIMPMLCGVYPQLTTEPKEATPGILPHRCMAHMLRDEGYATAFFQPAENFEKRSELVANMGFDLFRGYRDMPAAGFEKVSYFGGEDKMMLGPSMRFVDSMEKRPFFLTYLTLATHHNYTSPQSFPYVDYKVADKDERNYMNAARYIDDFVREVVGEFEKRGLLENTVFFIGGDHGEGFAEHGRRQHDLVIWEEGLHTAALLFGPRILGAPGHIGGVRSNLDWVPTAADLLGITPMGGRFVGQSLLKPVPRNRRLFFSCWFTRQCLALREGPVKTIYFYDQRPMEVYDNVADPRDERNLAFTGRFDARALDRRKEEMLHFREAINQQYDQWATARGRGRITTEEPQVAHPLRARFGDKVELIGYEVTPERPSAGSDLKLKYVFKCLARLGENEKLFVHLTQGRRSVNGDHVPLGGSYPPSDWQPGEYIVDEHTVHVPGTWSGGELRVLLGFWDSSSKQRLPVSGTDAEVDDSGVVVAALPVAAEQILGPLSIEALRDKIKDSISFAPPRFASPVGATFGGAVELTGVTLVRTDVELAGTVEMTYVFHALKEVPPSWKLVVRLVRDERVSIKGDHDPIGGLYPMSLWREGEYVVDRHRIHIDMYASKVGTYTAWLGFTDNGRPVPASGGAEIDAGQRVKLGTVVIRKDSDPHLRK